MNELSENFDCNVRNLNERLGVMRNYDLVGRDLQIAGRRARFYFLDGYSESDIVERVLACFLELMPQEIECVEQMEEFASRFVSYGEAEVQRQIEPLLTAVLLGKSLLLIEGISGAVLIDAKSYPGRGVEEPSDGRVLRGAHDGFTEVIKKNSALIRRRIRDADLVMENHKVGERTHTDVVLCYLAGKADEKLLERLRSELGAIRVNSLSMGQESVAEAMERPAWYNPFPRVRYTERPDAAAAAVMEGRVVLMVDNTPSVMILPTCFFDFTQDTNDFYFPPLVGTYLRLVRLVVFLSSLVVTPLWYLLMQHPQALPPAWEFLRIEEPNGVPLLAQLLLLELIVDLLKLASLNTPDVFSNSFSMLGALILGDFAVQANWLVPEVLIYIAFVAIANFTQPSFELGYAVKLSRELLLICAALFSWWGLAVGGAVIVLQIIFVRPLGGGAYLYPLIPFRWKALRSLIFRCPIGRDNT